MSRTYDVVFRGVSVSAVQDLICAYSGASMAIEIVSLSLGQISNPTTPALLRVGVKHLPATVTSGSGGGATTPAPDRPTDVAATFTARINDTTGATTGGTATYQHVAVWNTVNGFDWIFPAGSGPRSKLSEALAFVLEDAPAGAIVVSGTMKVRELI